MSWTRFSDEDPLPPPPQGWQRSVIIVGDTLALLEKAAGVAAHEIAKANGVPWPGRKSCQWGRDIAAWVLGTGGARQPFVSTSPNTCEPGLGYPTFVPGQTINLPIGVRPPASSAPVKVARKSKAPLVVLGVVAVAGAAAAARRISKSSKRKAA